MMKTTSVDDYFLTYAKSPLSNWEFSEEVTNLIETTTPEVVILDANDGEEPGPSGLQVKKKKSLLKFGQKLQFMDIF